MPRAKEVAENRIADAITGFAGSMAFVYIHIVWFACWIGLGVEHYPFGLLTMIVSLEAIFLSTFVMISQNRADSKRQVLADQQWTTVQEDDQNKQLLSRTRQILALTEEVRGYAGLAKDNHEQNEQLLDISGVPWLSPRKFTPAEPAVFGLLAPTAAAPLIRTKTTRDGDRLDREMRLSLARGSDGESRTSEENPPPALARASGGAERRAGYSAAVRRAGCGPEFAAQIRTMSATIHAKAFISPSTIAPTGTSRMALRAPIAPASAKIALAAVGQVASVGLRYRCGSSCSTVCVKVTRRSPS